MEVPFPPPHVTCAPSPDFLKWLLFVVRAPFPADAYSVCLASQKKLLKHLIVLDKVITRSVRFTGCRAH